MLGTCAFIGKETTRIRANWFALVIAELDLISLWSSRQKTST